MRKFVCISLMIAVLATSAFFLVACNSDDQVVSTGEFLKDVANVVNMPDFASLFTADDNAAITKGVEEAAKATDDTTRDEEAIKDAVMLLYNTANTSRLNNEKGKKGTSLMVQRSLGGNAQGRVYMNGFTLQSGGKWYYQLASQAAKGDVAGFETIARIMSPIAGKGAAYSCDCSVPTFPYAKFEIQEKDHPFETPLTLDEFNNKLHVLSDSIHEINNMDFCADIIADNATIKFENGIYTVDFAIDMDSDAELLEKWFAKPEEDMEEGPQSINKYNSYTATLQAWDNGYAKYFESHADRDAGTASGKPVDKYSYVWTEAEMLKLVGQDVEIKEKDKHNRLETIDDYIEMYSNPDYVNTINLGFFEILGIVLGCIAAVVIVIVVTIEVLVKQGKLPKLAAKREKAKQKRLAKKAAKQEKRIELIEVVDDENENVENLANETADTNGKEE